MHNVKNSTIRGFEWPRLDLVRCPICHGKAVVKGVFYERVCVDCNGSGWVVEGSRLVLPLEELVTQLSFKLQAAEREMQVLKSPSGTAGPERFYNEPNRRGAGGSNFTGD